MSERLKEAIKEVRIKEGKKGIARLAKTIGRTPKTLERWEREGLNDPHKVYKLALACGIKNEEALKLALEASPVEAESA